MKITASINSKELVTDLSVTAPRMLPYVAATMLTKLAGDARDGLQKRMPEVFDRPTDFTVRGVFTKSASRDKLQAEVYFPQSQEASGLDQREFMRPGVYGTYQRAQKKTEFLLTRLGVLPAGWVTTPGKGAKLDSHGNIAGGVYKQIINALQLKPRAMPGGGFRGVAAKSQRRAAKLGVAAEFFAVPPGPNKMARGGGWLPPGVWRHLPKHRITQVLKFVKQAGYKPHLKIKEETETIVRRQLPARWREASATITERFSKRGR